MMTKKVSPKSTKDKGAMFMKGRKVKKPIAKRNGKELLGDALSRFN